MTAVSPATLYFGKQRFLVSKLSKPGKPGSDQLQFSMPEQEPQLGSGWADRNPDQNWSEFSQGRYDDGFKFILHPNLPDGFKMWPVQDGAPHHGEIMDHYGLDTRDMFRRQNIVPGVVAAGYMNTLGGEEPFRTVAKQKAQAWLAANAPDWVNTEDAEHEGDVDPWGEFGSAQPGPAQPTCPNCGATYYGADTGCYNCGMAYGPSDSNGSYGDNALSPTSSVHQAGWDNRLPWLIMNDGEVRIGNPGTMHADIGAGYNYENAAVRGIINLDKRPDYSDAVQVYWNKSAPHDTAFGEYLPRGGYDAEGIVQVSNEEAKQQVIDQYTAQFDNFIGGYYEGRSGPIFFPPLEYAPPGEPGDDWSAFGKVSVAQVMYHVAPQHARDSIAAEGLRPGHDPTNYPDAVYLWPQLEHAQDWAARNATQTPEGRPIGHDVYEVNTQGLPLERDPWIGGIVDWQEGDPSYVEQAMMHHQPIGPERLRLLNEGTTTAKTANYDEMGNWYPGEDDWEPEVGEAAHESVPGTTYYKWYIDSNGKAKIWPTIPYTGEHGAPFGDEESARALWGSPHHYDVLQDDFGISQGRFIRDNPQSHNFTLGVAEHYPDNTYSVMQSLVPQKGTSNYDHLHEQIQNLHPGATLNDQAGDPWEAFSSLQPASKYGRMQVKAADWPENNEEAADMQGWLRDYLEQLKDADAQDDWGNQAPLPEDYPRGIHTINDYPRVEAPTIGEYAGSNKPLLLVDVDGVLNALDPYGYTDEFVPKDYEAAHVNGYRLNLSEQNNQRMAVLGQYFDLMWATAWEHNANQFISPLHDMPTLPVMEFNRNPLDAHFLPPSGKQHEFFKTQELTDFGQENIKPIAFIDDCADFSEVQDWAKRRSELGVPTLALGINPTLGLTDANVQTLVNWAKSLSGWQAPGSDFLHHAMAADPAFVQQWIDANGPYLYHGAGPRASGDFGTGEEMVQSILKNGIQPGGDNRVHDELPRAEDYDWTGHDTDNYEMPHDYDADAYEWWLKPRPNHTYMVTDPSDAYGTHLFRVDLRKLDPANLNADDDYLRDTGDTIGPHILPGHGFGDTWDEVRQHMKTLGDQAEEQGWGDNPQDTADSFTHSDVHNGGVVAHRGPIPPHAIELVGTRDKNVNRNWNMLHETHHSAMLPPNLQRYPWLVIHNRVHVGQGGTHHADLYERLGLPGGPMDVQARGVIDDGQSVYFPANGIDSATGKEWAAKAMAEYQRKHGSPVKAA